MRKLRDYIDKFAVTGLVIILSLSVFTPLKILSVIAIICLFAISLNRIFAIAGWFIAFILFFSINTVLAGLFYLLRVAAPIEFILLAQLLIGLCLNYVTSQKIVVKKGFNKKLSVAFLIVSGAIFIILSLPMVKANNADSYRLVAFRSDNISHIELIKAVNENGGYFYKNPSLTGYRITENLAGYPQGFHFNVHVFIEVLRPIFDTTVSYRRLIFLFYLFSVGMYVLLGAMFIVLAIRLTNSSSSSSVLLSSAVGLVLFTGLFFSLFALGFQTQIVSLALMLAMLLLLHESVATPKIAEKKLYSLIGLVFLAGISFTWLFLLPVAGLVYFLYWTHEFIRYAIGNIKDNIVFLFLTLLLSLFVLIQPLVQIINQTSRTPGVNEIGFTVILNTILVIALIVVALGSLTNMFNKKERYLWLVVVGVSSLFSLYIYVYQWSRVGEARYYYHKSLFTLVLIGALLLSAFLVVLIQKSRLVNRKILIVSIFTAGVLISIYNVTNKTDYFQRQKSGGFSNELSVTIGKLIENDPSNGKKIIAVGSCNRAHDYVANRLASVLTDEYDIWRQGLVISLLAPDRHSLTRAIKTYQEIRSPELIIISTDYPLQKELEKELSDDYGKETFIDLDFGHVPKSTTDCPNLVR